jgi:hypothetical protein
MSAKQDGGPAYPAPAQPKTDWSLEDVTSGMSLRDWFAGQALLSMGSWSPTVYGGPHGGRAHDLDTDAARQARAKWAYSQADAMLAERSKP